jgi:hypothetical protein
MNHDHDKPVSTGRNAHQIRDGLLIPRNAYRKGKPKRKRADYVAPRPLPIARLPIGWAAAHLDALRGDKAARLQLRRQIGLRFDEVQAVVPRRGPVPAHLKERRQHVARVLALILGQRVDGGQGKVGVTLPALALLYGVEERTIKRIAAEADGAPTDATWLRRRRRVEAAWRREQARIKREAVQERRDRAEAIRRLDGLDDALTAAARNLAATEDGVVEIAPEDDLNEHDVADSDDEQTREEERYRQASIADALPKWDAR